MEERKQQVVDNITSIITQVIKHENNPEMIKKLVLAAYEQGYEDKPKGLMELMKETNQYHYSPLSVKMMDNIIKDIYEK